MAKFKNVYTQTGRLSFNGARIEFSDILETEDKDLIEFLSDNASWIALDADKKLSELDKLKIEAEELGLKFKGNVSLKKLTEQVEEAKKAESEEAESEEAESEEAEGEL